MALRFSLAERKPDSIKSIGGSSGNAVQVINRDEVAATIKKIHTAKHDSKEIDWILLSYDTPSDTKTLKVIGVGEGGIEELRQCDGLTDDVVAYGLVRVVDVVDNIPTTRFIYITWMGDNVSGVTKARTGTNKASVTEFIGHYNVELLASKKEELTQGEVTSRVTAASGSKNSVIEKKQPSNANLNKPSGGGPSSYVPKPATGELTFKDNDGIKAVIKKVRDDNDPTDWILLHYTGKNELSLLGSGSGGLNELSSHLADDGIFYGMLRVEDNVDKTKMYRFIYIRWIGEKVSTLRKGAVTSTRGAIEDSFQPFHIVLNCADKNDITEKVIADKVQALKGTKAK